MSLIFKLVSAGFRQLSRPLAGKLTNYARTNDFLKHKICIPCGNIYHYGENYITLKTMNVIKPKNIQIRKLTNDSALELGITVLAEGIVFGIGATVILLEVMRRNRNDNVKELKELENFVFDEELKLLNKRFDQHEFVLKMFHNSFEGLRKQLLKEYDLKSEEN